MTSSMTNRICSLIRTLHPSTSHQLISSNSLPATLRTSTTLHAFHRQWLSTCLPSAQSESHAFKHALQQNPATAMDDVSTPFDGRLNKTLDDVNEQMNKAEDAHFDDRMNQAMDIESEQLPSIFTYITSDPPPPSSHQQQSETPKTFEELLNESPLFQMGRPQNKRVIGVVTDVIDSDLYVDFGGKFEAVVPFRRSDDTTSDTAEFYRPGEKVELLLKSFERVGKFLGEEHHVTVCEADAKLIKKHVKRPSKQQRERSKADQQEEIQSGKDFIDLLKKEQLL